MLLILSSWCSTSTPVQAVGNSDTNHHGSSNNNSTNSSGLGFAAFPTITAGGPHQNRPASAMLNTWLQERDRGSRSKQEALFEKHQVAGRNNGHEDGR